MIVKTADRKTSNGNLMGCSELSYPMRGGRYYPMEDSMWDVSPELLQINVHDVTFFKQATLSLTASNLGNVIEAASSTTYPDCQAVLDAPSRTSLSRNIIRLYVEATEQKQASRPFGTDSSIGAWDKFWSAFYVEPKIDPMDINHQLSEMMELNDGWAEGVQPASEWGTGYGKAPTEDGLLWLTYQFTRHYSEDITRPYLYPTPEGGVQAEWSIESSEVSLEIDLSTRTAEWHCLNVQTGHDCERILDLDRDDAWTWLAEKLRQLGQ